LAEIRASAGVDFAGVGLIVHDPRAVLPTFPLRPAAVVPSGESVEQSLAVIASAGSDLHDGFHLLSTDWKISAVAQYFSPPIPANPQVRWDRKFGGRYLAAQFGSALPGVELCGIATRSLGIAVFKDGHEIHFEAR
jgi:hypothetical protein